MSDKKAVVYCRTATTEQDIKAQLELCKKYADEHGYKVENVFMDHGFSANADRPELEELRKFMDGNPSRVLIVSSYDRLYRDSMQMHEFIQFAKKTNHNVVTANDKDSSLKELELICGIDKMVKEQEASE
ncbi:recombinase family protein [Paenibacillus alvei]|uniref:recombinase family protein n=1 Tax=Paenibacillus alvei TaxID=44250 RepID=UPI0022813531|nr:recombinase family protein [Paenibacillus alvei]MCY7485720.1 recombinase family protein [Paenibacillus alvei]